MAYSKQTWDTTSYVNPTRMNHIEDGIYSADTKTASDIPYSTTSGVSIRSVLDVQEITNADLSAFADSTKIKIHRMDKIVQIAFNGAKLSSGVARYGEIIKNLPANLPGAYVGGFIIKLSSGTSSPTAVYLNPLSQKLQIDSAVSTSDEIYGSFQYICQ